MHVLIESAIPLESTHRKEIERVLSKRLGTKLTIEEKVSPSILGGLRVTIDGSKRIDLSVLGKLKAMKKSLVG